MTTKVLYHGHSTFQIETGEHTLLIDPFFTGNPSATQTADEQSPDVILITHGHGDHVGDAVAIAKRTGCLCIANFEIVTWLEQQGVENCHAQHIGGGFQHPFGHVKLTTALHGSMLPDGSNGGMPCGLLLTLEDGVIYHAGDTGLFSDMQLIGHARVDLAILPIGDNFTMGPADAVEAVKYLNCKRTIPMHYNTWPPIKQDPEAWAHSVRTQTHCLPVILQPGESLTM